MVAPQNGRRNGRTGFGSLTLGSHTKALAAGHKGRVPGGDLPQGQTGHCRAVVRGHQADPQGVIGAAAIVPHNAMADSLMDEISAFVESNTEAEIVAEIREIR